MSEGPTVAVVAAESAEVAAAVEAAGGRPVTGPAGRVADRGAFAVAVGEPALLATARASPDGPVLPVDAGRGVRSVPRDRVADALTDLLDGDFRREVHDVCEVAVADATRATVLFDATLVTAEPAEISEFAVSAGGESVADVRADGVAVATAAGSSGYARRAGGSVVAPETNGVVVAPIAPFATDVDQWVVPPDGVRVSVERDEAAVALIADGRVVGPVPATDPVEVVPMGSVAVAVVDASASRYRSP